MTYTSSALNPHFRFSVFRGKDHGECGWARDASRRLTSSFKESELTKIQVTLIFYLSLTFKTLSEIKDVNF